MMVRGVAAFLIVTPSRALEPFVYVTTQARDQLAVSPETVLVSHPCVIVTPVGSHANATVTLTLYQSVEQPPPLQVTVIGAAPAVGGKTRSGKQIRSSATGYRQFTATSLPSRPERADREEEQAGAGDGKDSQRDSGK